MTSNAEATQGSDYSNDEVATAESQEQEELNAAQKAYLQRRVVTLRVQNNRLQSEVDRLRLELDRMNALLPAAAPGGEGSGGTD